MGTNTPLLEFNLPWMNAAGSLGFTPDPRGDVSLDNLGAFVTNPISLRARKTAQGTRLLEFPGGVLLHTGHPNPGLRTVIRENANSWARSSFPIIIHLLAAEPKQLRAGVPRIEDLENILAIELRLAEDNSANELTQQIKAVAGELPIIAQLPFDRATELADAVLEAGASAVSLAAPRGSLPAPDGKLVNGRLYGPAIFPLALAATALLAKQGIPVIAAGGVTNREQGEALLAAGAIAFQMDISLWSNNNA